MKSKHKPGVIDEFCGYLGAPVRAVMNPRKTWRSIRYNLGIGQVPDIRNASDVARYIDSNMGDVKSYSEGNLPLIYLFSMTHMDGFWRCAWEELEKIIETFNLDIIGCEGYYGSIDDNSIEEEARKSHYPLDHYLKMKPPIKIGQKKQKLLVGLEDKDLYLDAIALGDANRELWRIITAFQEHLNINPNHDMQDVYQQFQEEIEYSVLPKIRKFLEKFPDYRDFPDKDKGFAPKNPFFHALCSLASEYTLTRRSIKAVDLALDTCERNRKLQIAMAFGEGHSQEIRDELEKRGKAYVEMGV